MSLYCSSQNKYLTSSSAGSNWIRDSSKSESLSDSISKKEEEDEEVLELLVYGEISGIKARYTLFANNSEIEAKRRKTDVQQIVYERRSPCFVNRFFAIHCTQDLRRGSSRVAVSSTKTKYFFVKKNHLPKKIDGEQ